MQRIASWMSSSSSLLSNSSTRASAETPNLLPRLSLQCHTSSVAAASVPSYTSQVKRTGKKASKEERKSMAEPYINKYRAMNSGKFPSAENVRKEIGGSYYIVRRIVQELQYESQMSSASTRNLSLPGKEVKKEKEPSNGVVKVLSNQMAAGEEIREGAHVESLSGKQDSGNYESLTAAELLPSNQQKIRVQITDDAQKMNEIQSQKERAKESVLTEVDQLSFRQRTMDAQLREDAAPTTMSAGITEAAKNDVSSSQVETVLGSQMADAKLDIDIRTLSQWENPPRGPSKEKTDGTELQRKSSTWERLKSLADGIISIWRKS